MVQGNLRKSTPTEAEGITMRPKFSPDGRWIAHALREGGGWSLYLMTFPVTERKWHLTGATPRIGSTQVHFDDFPTPLTALYDIAITRDGQRFLVSDAGGGG